MGSEALVGSRQAFLAPKLHKLRPDGQPVRTGCGKPRCARFWTLMCTSSPCISLSLVSPPVVLRGEETSKFSQVLRSNLGDSWAVSVHCEADTELETYLLSMFISQSV